MEERDGHGGGVDGGVCCQGLTCPNQRPYYHRDDVLLYIAYVMLIRAAPIPADRWHCSLWP